MFGGMNPAQMQKMMKQMGIKTDEINAKKVIIETDEGNLVIEGPQVTKMTIQGQDTFQIIGSAELEETSNASKISEEDIKMVSEQAGVSRDKAKEALEKTEGDIAEAIVELSE